MIYKKGDKIVCTSLASYTDPLGREVLLRAGDILEVVRASNVYGSADDIYGWTYDLMFRTYTFYNCCIPAHEFELYVYKLKENRFLGVAY